MRAYVVASGLRLLLGLLVAGAMWSAGRTGSLGETLLTGVLVVVVLALSQEAAEDLITAAMLGRRLTGPVVAVSVVAGGSAGFALAAGRIVLPIVVLAVLLALVLLAASGRLLDPVYACVLQDVLDADAAMTERAQRTEPGRERPDGPDGLRGVR